MVVLDLIFHLLQEPRYLSGCHTGTQICNTSSADTNWSRVKESLNFSAVIKIRGVNPYMLVSRATRRATQIKSGWRRPLPRPCARPTGIPKRLGAST